MKGIIKICIRLFLIFIIFNFINSFTLSISTLINTFASLNKYNESYSQTIDKMEIIKVYVPFVFVWCIYLFVVIILWIKAENISKKIIGKDEIEHINIALNYKNLLSTGIIILGFYLIIDSFPRLFSYISNLIISKTRFVDKDFLKEYTIKEVVEILGILLKIIASYFLIKDNRIIIDKLDVNNKDK